MANGKLPASVLKRSIGNILGGYHIKINTFNSHKPPQ